MKTLGEAKVFARENIGIACGELELNLPKHKKRMGHKEACAYYNNKLFIYWLELLAHKIPPGKTDKVLEFMKKMSS